MGRCATWGSARRDGHEATTRWHCVAASRSLSSQSLSFSVGFFSGFDLCRVGGSAHAREAKEEVGGRGGCARTQGEARRKARRRAPSLASTELEREELRWLARSRSPLASAQDKAGRTVHGARTRRGGLAGARSARRRGAQERTHVQGVRERAQAEGQASTGSGTLPVAPPQAAAKDHVR